MNTIKEKSIDRLEEEYGDTIAESFTKTGSAYQIKYDTEAFCYTKPLFKIFQRFINPEFSTLLDVGAGYGTMSLFMSRQGFKVSALEIGDRYWKRSFLESQGINTIPIDVRKADLPQNQDVILFTEVIEHIPANPIKVMGKLREALSSKGVLIFSTPDCDSAWRKMGKLQTNVNHYLEIPEDLDLLPLIDEHFYVYSEGEIVKLFLDTGFAIHFFDNVKSVGEFKHIYVVATR